MHKIYLRDFYLPPDIVSYSLSLISFSLFALFYLSAGTLFRKNLHALFEAVSLLKIANALSVTTLFASVISTGKIGVLIRSYFSLSKSFGRQTIEKVEVLPDRMIVWQFEKEKKNSFYFSSFSDNDRQLTVLLKTIAPPDHRDKFG